MKQVSKTFFRFILTILIIVNFLPLHASETRVASMGKTGLFMVDNSNITIFPASIYRHSNLIYAELRDKNDQNSFSAGIHLPFGNQSIIGINLNRDLRFQKPEILGSSILLNQTNDLLIGYQMGENSLGVRLSYANEQNEFTGSDGVFINEMGSYFEFAGGVSNNRYDFGAYFSLPLIESEIAGDIRKWDGIGFGVSGRFFLGEKSGIQYVPLVVINQQSTILEENGVEATDDFLSFRMALGFRYSIDDKNLIVLGLEPFSIEKREVDSPQFGKTTHTIMNIPAIYLGGETRPKTWLLLRLGATQIIQSIENKFIPVEGETTKIKTRRSDFKFSVGVGFELGRFLLDLDINDHFLFEGPDFIGGQGNTEASDLVKKLSITYKF